MREPAGAVEDEVVLKRHVPDRNVLLRDNGQVAVRASDGEQADEPTIDVRRREPVKMAVIPVHSLRHVPRDVVGVGVRHAWRDVQQHVIGIPLRADVQSVRVKIQRGRGHLLRVHRNGLTLARVLRDVEIPDGEAAQVVPEVDDQFFAGKYLQRRRRIEIAARLLAVRRAAANHFIVEEKEVLDRRGHRIQSCLALPRDEPDFEHAVLGRERDRLPKFRSNRGIGSSLALCAHTVDAGTCQCDEEGDGPEHRYAKQAPGLRSVVE